MLTVKLRKLKSTKLRFIAIVFDKLAKKLLGAVACVSPFTVFPCVLFAGFVVRLRLYVALQFLNVALQFLTVALQHTNT